MCVQNAFLRPVHVLAMACVMKRPIVMYAVSFGRGFLLLLLLFLLLFLFFVLSVARYRLE